MAAASCAGAGRWPPVDRWKESLIQKQRPFSRKAQKRFNKLMKLAEESPYSGERGNARAAADRLAASHGMSLEEAAAGGINAEPLRPQYEPEVDRSAAQARPHRTYWNDGYGVSRERPNADWQEMYAEILREERRAMASKDRSLALWLAFLIFAISSVVGGVAFTLDKVGDAFRIGLPGS